MRRWFVISLALAACAPVRAAPASPRAPVLDAATWGISDAPGVRRLATRTIAVGGNPLEPVYATADPFGVAVTFADHGREGRTILLDARTLAARDESIHAYEDDEEVDVDASALALDGGELWSWTDELSSQVLVGTSRGGVAVVSSPELVAIGAPSVASNDGKHVVVVFFARDRDGIALVAVALEVGGRSAP